MIHRDRRQQQSTPAQQGNLIAVARTHNGLELEKELSKLRPSISQKLSPFLRFHPSRELMRFFPLAGRRPTIGNPVTSTPPQ